MRFVYFTHSLRSCWNHGNAHFLRGVLRELIEEHARETGSIFAQSLLTDWDRERMRFWQVCPKEMVQRLPQPLSEQAVAAAE